MKGLLLNRSRDLMRQVQEGGGLQLNATLNSLKLITRQSSCSYFTLTRPVHSHLDSPLTPLSGPRSAPYSLLMTLKPRR